MNKVVVAVRDSAADAFMSPFVSPSNGMAIRSFRDEVNRAAEVILCMHILVISSCGSSANGMRPQVCSLRVIVKC